MWNRDTGKPLDRAIVWQDRRTADMLRAAQGAGHEPRVRERTGLVLDPYFSRHQARVAAASTSKGARPRRGAATCASAPSTPGSSTSSPAAPRTSPMSRTQPHAADGPAHARVGRRACSSCSACPPRCCRRSAARAEVYGTTAGMNSLPDGIPVAGMAGDQQAALFGQACFEPGESKCTYGTGAFLLMNTGERAGALEGGAAHHRGVEARRHDHLRARGQRVHRRRRGAVAARWAQASSRRRRTSRSSRGSVRGHRRRGLRAGARGPGRAALAARDARGLFAGIDRSTTAAHLARAVLEGIALQIHDLARRCAATRAGHPRVQGGRRRGGQQPADAVPGGRARRAGGAPEEPARPPRLGAAFLGAWARACGPARRTSAGRGRPDKTFKPKMGERSRARTWPSGSGRWSGRSDPAHGPRQDQARGCRGAGLPEAAPGVDARGRMIRRTFGCRTSGRRWPS